MNKFKRFKEGLKNLTPLQQLNAKATGSLWATIGLSIAFLGMVYNIIFNQFTITQLGFMIFIVFIIYMQIVQYIGTKQQVVIIKEAQEKALDLTILKNL